MNEVKKRFVTLVEEFKGRVETVDGHTFYTFDDDETTRPFASSWRRSSGISPACR